MKINMYDLSTQVEVKRKKIKKRDRHTISFYDMNITSENKKKY